MKLSQLKKLIREEALKTINEEKETDEASLDAQVDRYFVSYETESKSSKKEGKDFRAFVRRFLMEAEGEEDDKGEEEKKMLTADDIDIENFTTHVVRLIDNIDSLLEIRSTISRRAKKFLLENYEPDVASQFEETLADQHDITIGETKVESDYEKYPAPAADRAGPGGGGGGA